MYQIEVHTSPDLLGPIGLQGLGHLQMQRPTVRSMDMALPPPLTGGWSDSHWSESMYIVFRMDCNSLRTFFGKQLLVL